jgi:hypothetical protein
VSVLLRNWSTGVLFRETPLELLSGLGLLSVAVNKMRYYYNIISSQQEAQLALVTMEP